MEILKINPHELFEQPEALPLFANRISCGFPSPADDYVEGILNLNEKLIPRPSSTFLVRAEGDSMNGAGIFEGDLLIVDKSITPAHNQIVIAVVNGEFTVKRLLYRFPKTFLQPENPKYKTLEITAEMGFLVWGTVTYAIHGFLSHAAK
jgi:DNA polymerase V